MSGSHKPLTDPVDRDYTSFEQNLALAWAQSHLTDFLRTNPHCAPEEKEKFFLDALEGGFGLALEWRSKFRD